MARLSEPGASEQVAADEARFLAIDREPKPMSSRNT